MRKDADHKVDPRAPIKVLLGAVVFGIIQFLFMVWTGYYKTYVLLWDGYLFEIAKSVLIWCCLVVAYFGLRVIWKSFKALLIEQKYE